MAFYQSLSVFPPHARWLGNSPGSAPRVLGQGDTPPLILAEAASNFDTTLAEG
ncbi:MAG: hypothetical protein WA724_01135 [Candidatus Dormiibacterota bacterium]